MLDYGPVQEFWLFSFERYNGILGKQPTNNRVIESQLIERFLRDNVAYSFSYPDKFKEVFEPLCESVCANRLLVGSVLDDVESNSFKLPTRYSRGLLTSNELRVLKQLYSKLSNDQQSVVIVISIFLKYSSIIINGRQFRSGKQVKMPVVALTSWDKDLFVYLPTPSRLYFTNFKYSSSEYSLFHESVFYCQYNFICVCTSHGFIPTLTATLLENQLSYGVTICLNHLVCILLYQ